MIAKPARHRPVIRRPRVAASRAPKPGWLQPPAVTTLCAAFTCLVFLLCLVRSWAIDLRIPFVYEGDSLYFLSIVRGLVHNQTWWYNNELGYPWGADLRDFPINMPVDYGLLWLAGKIVQHPGLLLNVYWMLAASLTAGLAAYSFLRLGIHPWAAFFVGVLYALQPFAIYRSISHFNLLFYCVPILMGFAVEWMSARPPASVDHLENRRFWYGVPLHVRIGALAQGLSYVYNAFFACLLFAVASAIMWLRTRKCKKAAPGLVVIAFVAVAFFVNTAPNFALWMRHGTNSELDYKRPYESELFALKIRHLITPISNHPLRLFRSVAEVLDRPPYAYETENRYGRLGTVGTLGFLLLLGYALLALAGGTVAWRDRRLGAAATLMLMAVLVGTVGGFGSVLITISSDIRAYNRIVVFISYFSFLTAGIVMTEVHRSYWAAIEKLAAKGNRGGMRWCLRWAGRALVLVLLAAMTLDETSTRLFGDYDIRAQRYYSIESFMQQIEAKLEPGAAVFTLPHLEFPVEPPVSKMGSYDHFDPYIHSHALRFSYGAIKGRGTQWSAEAAALPVEQMASRLALAGFSAVWIDFAGYSGVANSPFPQLSALPNVETLMSPDQRYAFVDLRVYRHTLLETLSPAIAKTRIESALNPVVASMRGGFFTGESKDTHSWHWSRRNGSLVLSNRGKTARTVTVRMTLLGVPAGERAIQIRYPGGDERALVPPAGMPFQRTITVPPRQETVITFSAQGAAWFPPGDTRDIYFGVSDIVIQQ
jgi:hypothetical protein